MARILNPGESLDVGDVRFDDFRRFKLVLQADGNLVMHYAALRPHLLEHMHGSTTQTHFGSDVQLHMDPSGVLQIRRKSDVTVVLWEAPKYTGFRWWPWDRPPRAGSVLDLQEDGNLCINTPLGTSNSVPWSMGDILLPQLDPEGDVPPDVVSKIVSYGSLVCELSDDLGLGGSFAANPGDCSIRNNTSLLVNLVTKTQRPLVLFPGQVASFCRRGESPRMTLFRPDFGGTPPTSVVYDDFVFFGEEFFINQEAVDVFRVRRSRNGPGYSIRHEATNRYAAVSGVDVVCASQSPGPLDRFEIKYYTSSGGKEFVLLFSHGVPVWVSVHPDPQLEGWVRVGGSRPSVFEMHVISSDASGRSIALRAADFNDTSHWLSCRRLQGGLFEGVRAASSSYADPLSHFKIVESNP